MKGRKVMQLSKKLKRSVMIAVISAAVIAAAVLAAVIYIDIREQKAYEALPAAVLHGDMFAENGGYDVKSRQYFVYDLSAGKPLNFCGAEKVVYPASCTKLLTALTALEYLNPDDIVTAGDEVSFIADGSSIAYIQKDMKLSVEMLIEGMLLPSGNDAAYVLAAAAGRKISGDDGITAEKAVETFVAEMNVYAAELGMCGSHFTTPDGYCGSDHYSTLEDMALLSVLAYNNDIIRKYASLPSDSVTYASGETNTWLNTNECLDASSEYYNKNIVGLKTGSLDKYYNLIAAVSDGGRTYIIGVFGLKNKEDRFDDVNTIADKLI